MTDPRKHKKRRQDEEQELNLIWLVIVFIFIITLPYYSDSYVMHIANMTGIGIIIAHGLNILMGYTGQVSLGHVAFVSIGAYTSAILTFKTGVSFWLALPLSGVVAALVGLIVAVPSLRLKEVYLAIATLGYSLIVNEVIIHWKSLTNGTMGMVAPSVITFCVSA